MADSIDTTSVEVPTPSDSDSSSDVPAGGYYGYPDARKDATLFDEYHGTEVNDPYRWLEDPDREETKAFVQAQNRLTRAWVDSCSIKDSLKKRISELNDYEKYSCPQKHGDRYFYFRNTGLQEQSVLCVQDSLDSESSVFLEPDKLIDDEAKSSSLIGLTFSEDGQTLAYSYSVSGYGFGSATTRFKKTPSCEDLPDILERVKHSSLVWAHGHSGLFYSVYPEIKETSKGYDMSSSTINLNQKLFFHRLGTDQKDDVLVADTAENQRETLRVRVSDCGDYLLLMTRHVHNSGNKIFYVNLKSLQSGINAILPLVKLVDDFDSEFEYVTNEGCVFTFKTNHNAPRFKLINVDLNMPDPEHWMTLVEASPSVVLEWAKCVYKDKLILCYLRDLKNEMFVHDLYSGQRKYEFPLKGRIVDVFGKKGETEIFYLYQSFLCPGKIYHCDLTAHVYEPTLFRAMEVKVEKLQVDRFVVKEVFFENSKGDKIPMSILHHKDTELDGSNATLLCGYGASNHSMTAMYSASRFAFLQHMEGVFAMANFHAGREVAETRNKGDKQNQKRDMFNDFQCAAVYLIRSGYTGTKRRGLVICGAWDDALAMSRCFKQRPNLIAGGIIYDGLFDMLRFHKFNNGHKFISDYGSSEDLEQYRWLQEFSPLHNVTAPEDCDVCHGVLLLSRQNESVEPLHSLKFIAQFQHTCNKQVLPLLLRTNADSCHSKAKHVSKVLGEDTDILCFIKKMLVLDYICLNIKGKVVE